MPRFNQTLDVVSGVAGGTTSINRVPYLSPSGGGRWFTDAVVICRVDEAPGSRNSWLVYLDKQGQVTQADPQGANFLSAGAGVYNASLDGLFRSNVGPADPYMGVGDTGFDGWSLVKERYHDDLPGMRILLRDPAGTIVQGFNTTGTVDFCIRNKDEFAWKEMDNTWRDPAILDLNYPAHNLRRWQDYVLYNDIDGRLIFHHLNDKTRGYVLATGDRSYWPDFIIRDGIIHYTYSTNLAEDPQAVVIASLPLSTPMEPLDPPFVVEPLGEKLVGPIFGSSEQYGYAQIAGNAEVLFGAYATYPASDWNKLKIKRPVICGHGVLNVPDAMRLGTWQDTRSTEPMTGPRPWFVYDEKNGEKHSGVGDVLLIQCYPLKGEDPFTFESRMMPVLTKYKNRQKILVCKFYPGVPPQNFTEAELKPHFYIYDRLVRLADGMLDFDGIRSHPQHTQPYYYSSWNIVHAAFADAAEGLPEFTYTPDPSPQPKKLRGPVYDYLRTS